MKKRKYIDNDDRAMAYLTWLCWAMLIACAVLAVLAWEMRR